MTLHEFGDFLKTKFPHRKDVPNEVLALAFLKQYPQLSYLVNSSSTEIQKLLKPSWFNRWHKRTGVASAVLTIQLHLEASLRGVDLPTLMQMKLMDHDFKLKVDMMKAERDHMLETHRLTRDLDAPDKRILPPEAVRKTKREKVNRRKEVAPVSERPVTEPTLDEDGESDSSRLSG